MTPITETISSAAWGKKGSAIIVAAQSGLAPREIAAISGWTAASVSSVLSRARAEGQTIPRTEAGRPKTGVGGRKRVST